MRLVCMSTAYRKCVLIQACAYLVNLCAQSQLHVYTFYVTTSASTVAIATVLCTSTDAVDHAD